jgi:predicted ABC-type ATPase
MHMPQIYIIAGPNGVGKTTYVNRFLPEQVRCLEFLNADMIAKGLSPFAPEKASIRAGRLMLERLNELLRLRESFSFETTLSGKGYFKFLRECRQAGYRIHLDFLWVPELQLTKYRVAQRVSKGGHDIPLEIQERRFSIGLSNFFSIYRPLIDHWRIFDTSGLNPLCLAEERDGELLVHVPDIFDMLRDTCRSNT